MTSLVSLVTKPGTLLIRPNGSGLNQSVKQNEPGWSRWRLSIRGCTLDGDEIENYLEFENSLWVLIRFHDV